MKRLFRYMCVFIGIIVEVVWVMLEVAINGRMQLSVADRIQELVLCSSLTMHFDNWVEDVSGTEV